MSSRENHPHSFVFPSRCSTSLTQTTSRAVQFSSIKFSLCTFDSSDNTYRQDALTIYRSVCEGEEEGGDIKNQIYKSATTDRAACVPCGVLRRQLPNSRSTPLRARRHARAKKPRMRLLSTSPQYQDVALTSFASWSPPRRSHSRQHHPQDHPGAARRSGTSPG